MPDVDVDIIDHPTESEETRRAKGLEIAALINVERSGKFYLVPSVTNPRPKTYKVAIRGETFACSCLDFQTNLHKCKHVYAVEFIIRRELAGEPKPVAEENVPVSKPRKTYSQNWSAYNTAQQNEKDDFQRLLADLCKTIPSSEKQGKGRPSFPLDDAVFTIAFKVYSTFSGRRFTSDLCDAQAKGFIRSVPHYNTAFRAMESPELFPILISLVEQSALPLKAIESQFAADSTGFAYSRFVRWFDIKYNKFTQEKQWVKAHVMCGTNTNVVTAIEIHGRDTNDCPLLPSLVENTAKNFDVKEVSADKGYSSGDNHNAIEQVGATPFIAFKKNANGGVGGAFERMWHFFEFNRTEFLDHYHRRSNVESTVMMIKTKFGDSVRSKSEIAAKNEVLCKVLCHNICCLISAVYELGVEVKF